MSKQYYGFTFGGDGPHHITIQLEDIIAAGAPAQKVQFCRGSEILFGMVLPEPQAVDLARRLARRYFKSWVE